MPVPLQETSIRPDPGETVTKALIRAADSLHVSGAVLARIIGVSEATITRLRKSNYRLHQQTKPFELAVLFVRLFRSLDAIVAGDEQVARAWLINFNTVLGASPLEKACTVSGLVDVIAYLDARRAIV